MVNLFEIVKAVHYKDLDMINCKIIIIIIIIVIWGQFPLIFVTYSWTDWYFINKNVQLYEW